MPAIGFVNGDFSPIEEAKVSIEDRGFQFSDGVYEVIGTYGGAPFALDPHMERLKRSLRELRIDFDVDGYGFEKLMSEGMKLAGFDETMIYMQITRGTAPRYHPFPTAAVSPTVVMTFRQMHRPSAKMYEKGVSVISVQDIRWGRCDIKSVSLLANVLAKQQAAEAGVHEALLVNRDGYVTEGAVSSCFFVRGGDLHTTPPGHHILPSITRAIVIDTAKKIGIPVHEVFSTLEEYKSADEVLFAGTTAEALGIVTIDESPIGNGQPGDVTRKLRRAFLDNLAENGPPV